MAQVRHADRILGQFLPNGSTPKKATGNNTFTASVGGISNYSSLRLRTDIELYVLATGTAGHNIDLSFAFETVMILGCVEYIGGSVALSNTPISDADLPSVTGLLDSWGQWEYLYPTIDFVNTLSPQLAVVTWRPKGETIDTQFRRSVSSIDGIDLWMPWEIQDGSGLINTTTAGVTYNLGARFAQTWFWETRT